MARRSSPLEEEKETCTEPRRTGCSHSSHWQEVESTLTAGTGTAEAYLNFLKANATASESRIG